MGYAFGHRYVAGWKEIPVLQADISKWKTSKVTNMYQLFASKPAFNADISSWDTSSVTEMHFMFYKASSFNQNISSWEGTASSTEQTDVFRGADAFQAKFLCADSNNGPVASCLTLKSKWIAPLPPSPSLPPLPPSPPLPPPPLSQPPVAPHSPPRPPTLLTNSNFGHAIKTCLTSDENAYAATGSCTSSEYGAMSNWNTSLVSNMSYAFAGKMFFDADISRWDTSAVTEMKGMFSRAYAFNQDIGDWDTSIVTDMEGMFYAWSADGSTPSLFNKDISKWNVSAVKTMKEMFVDANFSTSQFDLENSFPKYQQHV